MLLQWQVGTCTTFSLCTRDCSILLVECSSSVHSCISQLNHRIFLSLSWHDILLFCFVLVNGSWSLSAQDNSSAENTKWDVAVGDSGFPLLLCVLFDITAGWPSWTGWQEMPTKVKTQAPCKWPVEHQLMSFPKKKDANSKIHVWKTYWHIVLFADTILTGRSTRRGFPIRYSHTFTDTCWTK